MDLYTVHKAGALAAFNAAGSLGSSVAVFLLLWAVL
jgi:hypothetical protein